MAPTTSSLLALEIGGTKLQLVSGLPDGTILRRWRHAVDRHAGADGIRRQIEAWLPSAVRESAALALGVGFGGPVHRLTGRIAKSHQITGWSDFPIRDWLHQLSGLPVAVDNDANVAALGEALRGQGRGARSVFYITLGSGVGGGMVVDGQLYQGAVPGESEVGHLRLDKSGTLVEERCSGWAVDRRIREAIALHPGSPLALLVLEKIPATSPGGEAQCLIPALTREDPLAQAILSELADNLGFALSHVSHLFHPERIVLGGGLALAGEPLRAAVAEALKPYLMDVFKPGPQVFLSSLREEAVPIGGLLLAARASSGAPPRC